mmetsp:Transcript_11151/g.16729  ORF Transcript_11151/g.16729 Transcript_11151/m.16729 type:complete len:563 (+) Transcript_11151:31-1719(+)
MYSLYLLGQLVLNDFVKADIIQVACIGDSITYGSHSSDKVKYSYPAQLSMRLDTRYGIGKYNVTNLGVSGATVQRDGDKPYDQTAAYNVLVSNSWDIAFLMLGTNDAKIYNWNQTNFIHDYKILINNFNATEKYVLIPPPLMKDGTDDMNATVINELLPQLIPSVQNSSKIIDIFSAFGGSEKWQTDFPSAGCQIDDNTWEFCAYYCSEQSCDQCHPNDVGYARLAEAVYDVTFLSNRRLKQSRDTFQQRMGLGINLGNTLEAPKVGMWQKMPTAAVFDAYKAANFSNVRIPCRWDYHTNHSEPYKIDADFMDQVEQVVLWTIERDLIAIVNTHHEKWLDEADENFDVLLPRFLAIWQQVATKFANISTNYLAFEIFNEPHYMTIHQLNTLNRQALSIIRNISGNENRIVFLGGLQYNNPSYLIHNFSSLWLPDEDDYIMIEIHNYDPYGYAGKKPPSQYFWGTSNDISTLWTWFQNVSHVVGSIPIYYGEFGCTHYQNISSGRHDWYEQHRLAINSYGVAASVWDDNANFQLLNRDNLSNLSWDNDTILALGKIPALTNNY